MGEYITWAEKAKAEVDAFFRLWRERKWLAVVVLMALVGFCAWSGYSNWSKSQSIEQLKGEKTDLESKLRESDRENRGLRETVAPLLARAAKEFPGEEINSSLKKIVAKLESQDPLKQGIATVTATVEIRIKSDADVGSHFMDQGGYVALGQGADGLIVAQGVDSFGNRTGDGEVTYRGVFAMAADASAVGKPIEFLRGGQYVQTELQAMPEDSTILGGKVIFVINNSLHLEFKVPAQKADKRRVFIRDVVAGMKPLSGDK